MARSLILLDFDSTLVQVESLEMLAQIALSGHPQQGRRLEQIAELTRAAMTGACDFGESLCRRVALAGARREHVQQLAQRLPSLITPSVRRNLGFLCRHSQSIRVVSGGFGDYMGPAMQALGLRFMHANRLRYSGDLVVGCDRRLALASGLGKVRLAARWRRRGMRMLVLGDGHNDLLVRSEGVADLFCAFTENVRRPEVVEKADAEAASFDDFMAICERL